MAFTIHFEGLICHIGGADPKTKRHAALVSDKPTHNPTITVDRGTPRTLNQDEMIKFSTGSGLARTTSLFRIRVPGLEQLLPPNETIKPTVLVPSHDGGANGVLAYTIFPDGSLDAPELSFRPLDFDATDGVFIKKMCVSRGVMFTSDADATEVTVEKAGTVVDRVPLLPGSKVVIANTSSTTTGHFHLYQRITSASAIATATADKTRKCTPIELKAATGAAFSIKEQEIEVAEKRRPGRTTPHAECTNSNWP